MHKIIDAAVDNIAFDKGQPPCSHIPRGSEFCFQGFAALKFVNGLAGIQFERHEEETAGEAGVVKLAANSPAKTIMFRVVAS